MDSLILISKLSLHEHFEFPLRDVVENVRKLVRLFYNGTFFG